MALDKSVAYSIQRAVSVAQGGIVHVNHYTCTCTFYFFMQVQVPFLNILPRLMFNPRVCIYMYMQS